MTADNRYSGNVGVLCYVFKMSVSSILGQDTRISHQRLYYVRGQLRSLSSQNCIWEEMALEYLFSYYSCLTVFDKLERCIGSISYILILILFKMHISIQF